MPQVSTTLVLQGNVGETVTFPFYEADNDTGLELVDFTSAVDEDSAYVADPVTDLSLALLEVDSINLAGLYELSMVPAKAGSLHVRIALGVDYYEFVVQVSASSSSGLPAVETGGSTYGEVVLTVDDGSDPIEGVTVRVLASGGTSVVTSGTTDSLGEVTLTLPEGDYDVRYYKAGVTFTNPQSITVVANDDVTPVLDSLLTTSPVAVSTELALLGRYFEPSSSEVIFGAEPAVAARSNAQGTVLLATIPAALGSGATTVTVRKPDPDNVGQYLSSSSLTLVVP